MRWRLLVVLAPTAVAGVIAACNLNPQPLPPSDDNGVDPGGSSGSSGGFRGDDENGKETPAPTSTTDAGGSANDGDSSVEGGDGGSEASDHDADAG